MKNTKKFFRTHDNQYVSVTQIQLTRSGLFLQFHNDKINEAVEYCLVYRDYILGMVYLNEDNYESKLGFPPFYVSYYLMNLVLDLMKRLASQDISGMVLDIREYLSYHPQENLV